MRESVFDNKSRLRGPRDCRESVQFQMRHNLLGPCLLQTKCAPVSEHMSASLTILAIADFRPTKKIIKLLFERKNLIISNLDRKSETFLREFSGVGKPLASMPCDKSKHYEG